MTDVLTARDVGRRYGDTVALSGVSLSVAAGEVVALVGPNGAGKTTFVRAVTGTTDATGRVELFGRPPRVVDRNRLGVLPQEFAPHARLTAPELLQYYAGLYSDPRDPSAVLEEVGLASAADAHYETLSGGQKRRTCVGTALVNDPDLLVLDEPTTGIDPAGRRAIWELLETLSADGVTVLLTTHDMSEAHHLADRVGVLAGGDLLALDSPAGLVERYGGEPTLAVEGAVGESVVETLPYQAVVTDGVACVTGVPPEGITAVLERLAEAGVSYDRVAWAEPGLEDAYLRLVERSGPGAQPLEDHTSPHQGGQP